MALPASSAAVHPMLRSVKSLARRTVRAPAALAPFLSRQITARDLLCRRSVLLEARCMFAASIQPAMRVRQAPTGAGRRWQQCRKPACSCNTVRCVDQACGIQSMPAEASVRGTRHRRTCRHEHFQNSARRFTRYVQICTCIQAESECKLARHFCMLQLTSLTKLRQIELCSSSLRQSDFQMQLCPCNYRRVHGPTWSATSGRETKLRPDIKRQGLQSDEADLAGTAALWPWPAHASLSLAPNSCHGTMQRPCTWMQLCAFMCAYAPTAARPLLTVYHASHAGALKLPLVPRAPIASAAAAHGCDHKWCPCHGHYHNGYCCNACSTQQPRTLASTSASSCGPCCCRCSRAAQG